MTFDEFVKVAFAARGAHPEAKSTTEALRLEEENQVVGCLQGHPAAKTLLDDVREALVMAREIEALKLAGSRQPVNDYFDTVEHAYGVARGSRNDVGHRAALMVAREGTRYCYKCGADLRSVPALMNGAGWYCIGQCEQVGVPA